MSRLQIISGLPYKIVIESWPGNRDTHASSSSQEALLWKAAARGSREQRERSQSVPLTLPASSSSTLFFFYLSMSANICVQGVSFFFFCVSCVRHTSHKRMRQIRQTHFHRKNSLYLPLSSVNLVLKLMGTPDGISTRSG